MSRHGYSDDLDQWDLIKWHGQVASAIRGKRGQKLLVDLVRALDAMPEKELIASKLVTIDGEVCALGAVGQLRGTEMPILDSKGGYVDGAGCVVENISCCNNDSCWSFQYRTCPIPPVAP